MSDQKIKESNLYKWLSGARTVLRERLDLTRVENGVQSGTPDLNICYRGEEGWLELKAVARPARGTTCLVSRINLKPTQLSWMLRRQRAGGRVAVLLQVGSGATGCKYLIPVDLMHHLVAASSRGVPFTEARISHMEISEKATPALVINDFFSYSRFKGNGEARF